MDNVFSWLPALLATLFLALYATLWISWEIQAVIEKELDAITELTELQETLFRREGFLDPDLEYEREEKYLRISRLHRINYLLVPVWAIGIQQWLFTQNSYCDRPEA